MKMLIAAPGDLDSLYAILLDRSEWLKTKGIPQWNPVYPRARFESEIQGGQVYRFVEGDSLVGTVTLLDVRPLYYPAEAWNDEREAWYICRLATSPKLSGEGLGHKILILIEEEAEKREKGMLRLDIVKANPFLKSYYEAQGFEVVLEAESHGVPSLFMEKHL